MKYKPIEDLSISEIEAAIRRNQSDELLTVGLSASLYSSDRIWAESVCLRLAIHKHPVVRGNAILGFGHLARIHGNLTPQLVQPLIESALVDDDEFVRGQAEAAADDVEFFLGWKLTRP